MDCLPQSRPDGVTLASPDGQRRRVVFPQRPRALAWSSDGRALFALLIEGPAASPQAFDLQTGRGTTLREFAPEATPNGPVTPSLRLALSPGGHSLITSVLRHRSDIWLLER